jgi:hypothetical protein
MKRKPKRRISKLNSKDLENRIEEDDEEKTKN